MDRKLIGESMIEAHLITRNQLDQLLEHQHRLRERIPLGKLTIESGLITEDDFAPFVASYFNVPYVNIRKYPIIQKEVLEAVPEVIAKRLNILPLAKEDAALTVAVSDPLDLPTLENLQTITHCEIKPVVSAPSQIRYGIAAWYGIL